VTCAISVHRVAAGPWAQNCYVLATDGGDSVVVDPGGEAELIAAAIDNRDLRIHAVLATHGHHDHVGALAEISDRYEAPFGIHSADSYALRRVNFHRYAFHRLGPVEIPPIGIDLADVDHLRFGELELGVVATPGHTPGSVCFAIPNALLTGDTLMATGPGATPLADCDATTLEGSVQALGRGYPPETEIHPGHDEPSTLGEAAARSLTTVEPA